MAHYDNNLNDISEQIISDEKKKLTTLRYIVAALALTILILATLLGSEVYTHERDNAYCERQVEELTEAVDDAITNCDRYDISLDDSTLYFWAVRHKVQQPDLFCASVILESGAGRSNLAIRYCNLIGMKVCKSRKTTQVGVTPNGYGIYDSWRECLLDKIYWEDANIPKDATRETYKKVYCRTYAEDVLYCEKMEKVARRFDKFKKE